MAKKKQLVQQTMFDTTEFTVAKTINASEKEVSTKKIEMTLTGINSIGLNASYYKHGCVPVPSSTEIIENAKQY